MVRDFRSEAATAAGGLHPEAVPGHGLTGVALASVLVLFLAITSTETIWIGPPETGTWQFRFPPVLPVLGGLVGIGWIRIAIARIRRGHRTAKTPSPEPTPANLSPVLLSRTGKTVRLVEPSTIEWIEASGRYSTAHTADARYLLDESLTALTDALPQTEFVRVHRSAIVRADQVSSVTSRNGRDHDLSLKSGAVVRMSRTYRGRLEALLGVEL